MARTVIGSVNDDCDNRRHVLLSVNRMSQMYWNSKCDEAVCCFAYLVWRLFRSAPNDKHVYQWHDPSVERATARSDQTRIEIRQIIHFGSSIEHFIRPLVWETRIHVGQLAWLTTRNCLSFEATLNRANIASEVLPSGIATPTHEIENSPTKKNVAHIQMANSNQSFFIQFQMQMSIQSVISIFGGFTSGDH